MTLPPKVMRERARELLLLCVGGGREVTHDALQGIAREKYAKDTPYVEREEIITQALELYVLQQRGEETNVANGKLSTAEVRMHARDYWTRNPKGTAREAWKYVCEQGTPELRWSSFQGWIAVEVRAELGIETKPKGKRKKDVAAKKPPADPARASRKREALSASRTPSRNGDGARVEETPAAETPPREGASSETQMGPVGAEDDGIARILLETPVGSLTARDEGHETWLVEFRGSIDTEMLHLLVADLVGPPTAKRERAAP